MGMGCSSAGVRGRAGFEGGDPPLALVSAQG